MADTADTPTDAAPLVLFDGVCNLCDGFVQFVISNERPSDQPIRFASLQSATGDRVMREHGLDPANLDSVVFVEDGRAFVHSSAVARILPHLRAPWSYGSVMRWIPRFLRDFGYRCVAKMRYRLFGKKDTCMVPTKERMSRFVDL